MNAPIHGLDQAAVKLYDFHQEINLAPTDAFLDAAAAALFDAGFKARNGDAVTTTFSQFATRAVLTGFWKKPAKKTPWASGEIITLSDTLHPGTRELAYNASGGQVDEENDGIVARGAPVQTYVEIGLEEKLAKFEMIKTAWTITQEEIWEADLVGFSKFEAKGATAREHQMVNINKVIRQGSVKFKLPGVTTFKGTRRRISSVNWFADDPDDILAEIKASMLEFDSSSTEDPAPTRLVIPPQAMRHWTSKRVAVDDKTKILQEVEESFGLKVVADYGMRSAGDDGDPAAVFLDNNPSNIVCHVPLFMHMRPPTMEKGVMHCEIWTSIGGVQIRDGELVMVEEGPAWS